MSDQLHPEPGDRRDVLIGRIIDAEATGQDWAEFRQIAGDDQSVFAEIAQLQELRRRTMDLVEDAGQIADTVDLPMHLHARSSPAHRLRTAGVWGGWAAAAAVTLAWGFGLRPSDPIFMGDQGSDQAGIGADLIGSAEEAFQRYLDLGKQSGSVIGELPSGIVLDKRPLEDGSGYEALFLRPIIERVVVRNVYRQIQTESGQIQIVPAVIDTPNTPASPRPLSW